MKIRLLTPFLMILFLLAACSSGDEPTAAEAPTASDPTAGFVTLSSKPIGVTMQHPPDWATELDEVSGDIQLATDASFFESEDPLKEGAIVLVTNFPDDLLEMLDENIDADDPGAVMAAFFELITADEEEQLTERAPMQAFKLDGQDAARILYDVQGTETNGVALLTAVRNSNITVLMFGMIEESGEATLLPVLEAVFNSVKLSQPAGVVMDDMPVMGEAEVVELVAEATAVPAPENKATAVPTAEPEPDQVELRQWATTAIASSQYGDDNWSATQATGAPDTEGCGDITTAWAAAQAYGADEWLELLYTVPVQPTEINIFQNHGATQIVSIELLDTNGAYHQAYTAKPAVTECPFTLSVNIEEADYQVIGVRLNIDQSQLNLSWNEIDAVELVGLADPLVAEALGSAAPVSSDSSEDVPAFDPPPGFRWRVGGPGMSGAAEGQFAALGGMDVGPGNLLYVADNIHGVYTLDSSGNLIDDPISDRSINNAADVKVAADGKVYVAAWGSHNITVFEPAVDGYDIVAQFGEAGAGAGQFGMFSPQALAIDWDGNIYVLDENKDAADNSITRIQVFSPVGDYLYEFPIEEDFFAAVALEHGYGRNSDGNKQFLYVTGFVGGYVLKLDPATGQVLERLGQEALRFSGPQGITVDGSGNLYVAVWTPSGVRKLDADGNLVSHFGVELGLNESHLAWPEGGFIQPIGVAVSANGQTLFANDSNGPLRYITAFEME